MKRLVFLSLAISVAAHAQMFGERTHDGVPMEVNTVPNSRGTVIMAHGCAGPLYDRDEGWSKRLNEAGFSTVRFHSWRHRGMTGGVCQTDAVTGDQRVEDVASVSTWIREQPWHEGRLFVMGWSHGASTTLAAALRTDLGIAKAAAMYPWCHRHYASVRIPTQIHMGSDDDWTPPHLCRSLFKGWFSTNLLGQYIEHPGATHGFDRFTEMSTMTMGLGEHGQVKPRHQRTDPAARERAIEAVVRFFQEP